MSYEFNAEEILKIAEQIEKNGAAFYRSVADKITDPSAREMILEFAAMEDEHEKAFIKIKNELSAKEKETKIFDPQGDTELYLKSLADMRVFFEKKISKDPSLEEILKFSIEAEKDSIVFYLGMKDLVSPSLGQEKIDLIIREEMQHVRLLAGKLSQLR
jgi:rubrerythrin